MGNDLNSVFDPMFRFDISKSATADGDELMNRTGLHDSETKGPGRTGRPKKPSQPAIEQLKQIVDPANPHKTAIALDKDDEYLWLAGSIVRLALPDGTERSFVLTNDVAVCDWIDE